MQEQAERPQAERTTDQKTADAGTQAPDGDSVVRAPSISLPKGGGAIRGIGEKFAANPVTGTASLSVPIYTSPGRSGFEPQLSLSYDSGAGNGPFGFGWNLSLPSITRKTDKGLPRYQDADESDVFILSGAEDLVPVLVEADGQWSRESLPPRTVDGVEYSIHRYRPRIESLFARIERWTRVSDGETLWRSISRDNVTTWYGKTADSRIADPDDSSRIFSWLICESYDDKGNAIVYEYVPEDSRDGSQQSGLIETAQANERNRDDTTRSANRYLKRIKYGNKQSRLIRPDLSQMSWLFEVVFDYDEGHCETLPSDPAGHQYVRAATNGNAAWPARPDPFSTYRAGFEVRTYRLCRRALMFHHFPAELLVNDYLVRSTEFAYEEGPIASFITSVTQSGYVLQDDGTFLQKSLPPLEFAYSKPDINETVADVDPESLENLPVGLDGSTYQWVDLDGEGLSGILTEQAGGWYYKRNLSPLPVKDGGGRERTAARFGPLETVRSIPSLAEPGGRHRFLDLAGDGRQDVVLLERPVSGFYERTHDEGWDPFRNFLSCPNVDWGDPNLRFVDLTGDGHADILITEHEAFTWYPSLAEEGFAPAEKARQALDEERGPKLVFADGTQSIYLADLSGDGLTDLARIRNGEVCYWPNLGYGRFGPKVTMDKSPRFDHPDQFNQQRVRVADIDGSGTTDILYLHHDRIDIYRNESGNRWADPEALTNFPHVDNLSSVMAVDLLGSGTACLVWSSPLPGDASRPMRYIDLMGGQKPHLMIRMVNNLGAETRVTYAPSTKFYIKDRRDGRPWVTKIPFPVHVVERIETYDWVSRNRFVTRYAYHHGYFDGVEREFRGFGMVEQWDTEEFKALDASDAMPPATNIDEASHVPPVLTRTWFHTGIYMGRHHVSDFFAGFLDSWDVGEYYREPGLTDAQVRELLLKDTVLPANLTVEEEREACRALKGSMLREEVYARDGTDREERPYTVTEQNFTIEVLQARGDNRHAVFFTYPREVINYHYERSDPADPRVAHNLTLEADAFGNVLRSLAVGYPRADVPDRQPEQSETHLTLTLNRFANSDSERDWRRIGLPVETRTYEVVKPPEAMRRFAFAELRDLMAALIPLDQVELPEARTIPYEEWDWRRRWDPHAEPGGPTNTQLRLIEHVRTLYRPDDLGGAQGDPLALLPLGQIESMALPGEAYKLAFTPGLLAHVFRCDGQPLQPDPASVLGGPGADRGGYVASQDLKAAGAFPNSDRDDHIWLPSGRSFLSPGPDDPPAQELAHARANFFLPHRYRDPFHIPRRVQADGREIPAISTESVITYDDHKLLVRESRDALDNVVTAETEDDAGNTDVRIDYRVLQLYWLTDPNSNRTRVAFDALGMVAGTAVMGKPGDGLGDRLDGFVPDLTQAQINDFFDTADPHGPAEPLLADATTRIIYDLGRFLRTRPPPPEDQTQGQPAFAATIARETHASDPLPVGGLKTQIGFSYSDGFGREIQKKIQAEPGPVEGLGDNIDPRWVGSGWTVFNNKGKPVRKYEPFFSRLHDRRHRFEFGAEYGVSPILFYDPVERVVATLHPNHTYEKVVFDPWQQETWDVNDTLHPPVNPGDPPFDPTDDTHVSRYFSGLQQDEYLPTWYDLRTNAAKALLEWPDTDPAGQPIPQNAGRRAAERSAAEKGAAHANTPTTAHVDALGRPFLTLAHNGFQPDGMPIHVSTRTALDIEGNQREVIDDRTNVAMRYDYFMIGPEEDENGNAAGNRIHQASMDAGERWMLNDVAGNPIRSWDSRGHTFRTEYDRLRRPLAQYVTGEDSGLPDQRLRDRTAMVQKTEYGESHTNAIAANLRTRIFKSYDDAGTVTNMGPNPLTGQDEGYDFKGNLLRSARQLIEDYHAVPDWSVAAPPRMEAESFVNGIRYDALNRPIQVVAPHSDRTGSTVAVSMNVICPGYNEANLLERIDVWLGQATEPQGLLDPATASPHGVADIDYDAKGQRTRIVYGEVDAAGAPKTVYTEYEYDPDTFRLTHLKTVRPTFPVEKRTVQDLAYTYDPAGNIAHIEDKAQPRTFFDNDCIHASNDYLYDAIYRLIGASGREHQGDNGPTGPYDTVRMGHPIPYDCSAIRHYVERYEYDAVGNILGMVHHQGSNVGTPGQVVWRRRYQYATSSNRLHSTSLPGELEKPRYSDRLAEAYSQKYDHDIHGNMTSMPHLDLMEWDHRDQLWATARQVVNDPPPPATVPETTHYVYDASGQRVRKVTERQNGKRKAERIYLGGFEIYREYKANGVDVKLERETLPIMDDKQRIALVETRTKGTDASPEQLIHYQFGTHLGSASLELGDEAQVISYEEYYPYGSTSYQAASGITEVPKRYRYTGKERDEENGLYYFGARFYAPLLGRWCSADSLTSDGYNLYLYGRDTPVMRRDSDGRQSKPPKEKKRRKRASRITLSPTEPTNVRELPEGGFDFGAGTTIKPPWTEIELKLELFNKLYELRREFDRASGPRRTRIRTEIHEDNPLDLPQHAGDVQKAKSRYLAGRAISRLSEKGVKPSPGSVGSAISEGIGGKVYEKAEALDRVLNKAEKMLEKIHRDVVDAQGSKEMFEGKKQELKNKDPFFKALLDPPHPEDVKVAEEYEKAIWGAPTVIYGVRIKENLPNPKEIKIPEELAPYIRFE